MPEIDLNALKKRDPLAFHQCMRILRSGELLAAKEKLSQARDSTDRERAQRVVDAAKADVVYYQREIERLKKTDK